EEVPHPLGVVRAGRADLHRRRRPPRRGLRGGVGPDHLSSLHRLSFGGGAPVVKPHARTVVATGRGPYDAPMTRPQQTAPGRGDGAPAPGPSEPSAPREQGGTQDRPEDRAALRARLRFSNEDCSIARTLAVLGEKWTFLVLREAFLGVRRFADFQQATGAPRQVLSAR